MKLKSFLSIIFLSVLLIVLSSCGDVTSSGSIGGQVDDTETNITKINLESDPFSLLGIYDISLYGIDTEPNTIPETKSQLRVGVNVPSSNGDLAEILMYLDFEGKKITFETYEITADALNNYGGLDKLGEFISHTFASLGAELIKNDDYGLYFTLNPKDNPQYDLIVRENIITSEQEFFKIKLKKVADIELNAGLGLDTEDNNNDTNKTIPVESIKIKDIPAEIIYGTTKEFKLSADILPENATNKNIKWSSNLPEFVSVDETGLVTITKYPSENIIITAVSENNKQDTFMFNIQPAEVKSVTFSPSSIELQLRNDNMEVSSNLVAVIEPPEAQECNEITYKSNNTNIATVDSNGKVIAVSAGSTTITVKVGNLSKTINVKIESAPVLTVPATGIKITTAEKTYKKNSNIEVSFQLTPNNTTDKSVTYTFNGTSNKITANSNGAGTISLTNVTNSGMLTLEIVSETGNKYTATYNVKAVDGVTSINLKNTDTVTLEQNKTDKNITNDNTESANYTYYSSDNNIATVDSNGTVTGKKNGVATITVTATPKYEGGTPVTNSYQVDVLGHINYADADSLQGTYDIIFFGTNTNHSSTAKAVISNDCSLYPSFTWKNNYDCGSGTGGYSIPSGDFAGTGIISVSNNTLKVHTKVAFVGNSTIQSMSKDDQYQYTIYDDKTLSQWLDTNNKGNMNGRVLSKTSSISNATHYIEQNASYNGKKDIDMVLFSTISKEVKVLITIKLNPDTRLVLRKTSSQVKPMNPNTFDEEPFKSSINGRLTLSSGGNITLN